jgi:hypothetical protein
MKTLNKNSSKSNEGDVVPPIQNDPPTAPGWAPVHCPNTMNYNVGYSCPGNSDHAMYNPEGANVGIGQQWYPNNACAIQQSVSSVLSCPCNGEWSQSETGASGGCYYDDCNFGSSGGCTADCSSCFSSLICSAIVGAQLICTRQAYNATPAVCCISNSATTNDGQLTCDPQYRSWNNAQCAQPLSALCSSIANMSTSWAPGGVCDSFMTNSQNQSNKEQVLSTALQVVASTYTPQTQDPVGLPLWSQMIKYCAQYPDACDSILTNSCQYYTRDQVSNAAAQQAGCPTGQPCWQTNFVGACGCHLPASQYTEYQGLIDQKYYNTCDPLCVLPGTVPKTADGQPITCQQTNCILDDITVNVINSEVGDITFSNVCSGCQGGDCLCYFTDINVFAQGSQVGNINFSNNCGGCFIYNPLDPANPQPIDCSSGQPITNNGNITPSIAQWFANLLTWISTHKTTFFIIALIIVAIVILTIFVIGFQSERRKRTQTPMTSTGVPLSTYQNAYVNVPQ